MTNDLISRQEVLSTLEEVFKDYGIEFNRDKLGFAGEVPAAIEGIPGFELPEKKDVAQARRELFCTGQADYRIGWNDCIDEILNGVNGNE